jgi:hypothetical protein
LAIILPANTLAAGGFSVDNSCVFIEQDSPKLTRTLGTPTDRDKWTWSAWVKIIRQREQGLFFGYIDANNYAHIEMSSTGQFKFYNHLAGSANAAMRTVGLLRDSAAWYHLVLIWDSGNATEANRLKMYINGVHQIGSLITSVTYPSQDDNSAINGDNLHEVGVKLGGYPLDGYMAEVCFVDGQALAPTEFGEYDEDSPTIWKPKNVSGLTFGDNGAYFDFEDSANLGNDAQGGTDWSESNISAVHQAEDTPTNNFCILSQLQPYGSVVQAYHDGATKFVTSAGNAWRVVSGSIAVTTGKYYYEVEINTASANNSYSIGWLSTNNLPASVWTSYLGDVDGPALGLGKGGTLDYSTHTANSQTNTGWTSYTNGGNIIMCAIDLDNNFAYWGLDGTWMKSGNPESGATGTGGFAFENTAGYDWYPAFGSTEGASGGTPHMSANFGNGSFANVSGAPSAVASAGSNASGFGVFEFNVPAGYGAICTKQMNE